MLYPLIRMSLKKRFLYRSVKPQLSVRRLFGIDLGVRFK